MRRNDAACTNRLTDLCPWEKEQWRLVLIEPTIGHKGKLMNKTQIRPLNQTISMIGTLSNGLRSSGFSFEFETKLFEVGEQLIAGQSHTISQCHHQVNCLVDRPKLCLVHQLAFMSDEHKSSLLFFSLTNGSESICFRSRRWTSSRSMFCWEKIHFHLLCSDEEKVHRAKKFLFDHRWVGQRCDSPARKHFFVIICLREKFSSKTLKSWQWTSDDRSDERR